MINNIQDKILELKSIYDNSKFKFFFTEDCEYVYHIDFDNNIVYIHYYILASCGCCSDIEDKEIDLEYFLQYLSDDDYQKLLAELKK